MLLKCYLCLETVLEDGLLHLKGLRVQHLANEGRVFQRCKRPDLVFLCQEDTRQKVQVLGSVLADLGKGAGEEATADKGSLEKANDCGAGTV